MAKEKKRKHEIEEMIAEQARKYPECEGASSFDVYKVTDDSVEFTWKANCHVLDASPPDQCEAAILTQIIPGLQALYDLADD
jgi:hypothetical protein